MSTLDSAVGGIAPHRIGAMLLRYWYLLSRPGRGCWKWSTGRR